MKDIDDLPADLRSRLARVRLLLMDVDGVLTDGLIRLDENALESKTFSLRDGLALFWVRRFGLITGVISGRRSAATETRCRDLHMDEIHLGHMNKTQVYAEVLARRGIAAEETAYIGDDMIDLAVMQRAGISAAPNDAHPEVLRRVDLVLDYPGGRGAVRQFLDLWLKATGQWDAALQEMLNGRL